MLVTWLAISIGIAVTTSVQARTSIQPDTFRYDMNIGEILAFKRAGKDHTSGYRNNLQSRAVFSERPAYLTNALPRSLKKRGNWATRGLCISKNHHDPEAGADVTYTFKSAYCEYPEHLRSYVVECVEIYHGLIQPPQLVSFRGYCALDQYCVNDFELGIPNRGNDITCAPILAIDPEEPYSISLSPTRDGSATVCSDTKQVPFKIQSISAPNPPNRDRSPSNRKRVRRFRVFEQAVDRRGKAIDVARLWIEDLNARFQFPRAERWGANMTALTITVDSRSDEPTHSVRFCAELGKGHGPLVVLHYGSYEVTDEFRGLEWEH